jgi:hypothetical protein
MKKLLPLVLLGLLSCTKSQAPLTASLSVPCSSQTYACDYAGVDVVQPGPAPFTSLSPINTVVQETVLSKARISRVTGPSSGGGVCKTTEWNSTPSGGAYDVITNVNGTLLGLRCDGGESYIVGFNPHSLQVYPASGTFTIKCNGSLEFSRTNYLEAYCTQGTTLSVITFVKELGTNLCGQGIGSCPSITTIPTWATVYDFSTCPKAPTGSPLWHSILGVGRGDTSFAQAFSYSGGQNTGHILFYLKNGKCSTFDTQGNGTNPIWYNSSNVATILSSVNAVWTIHDVTSNGPYVAIPIGTCKGTACGGDGPPTWEANTSNVIMFNGILGASGHHDYSMSYFLNSANPIINRHQLTSPTASVKVGTLSCSPCQDTHFNAAVNNDTDPILGTTAGPNGVWTAPYKNEVYGMSVTGTIWRFSPCWTSGTTVTNFWAQNCIGAPNQPRTVMFITSDMLGQLGKTGTLNRWDIFAVGLVGQ